MPKPLSLDRDNALKISEASVERTISDFLRAEGWQVHPLKAEARMPNGAAAHPQYTLDLLAVKIVWRPEMLRANGGKYPSRAHALYLEAKRKNARTGKKRLAGQTANAEGLRRLGFTVYQAPEGFTGDMIAHFREWYEEKFR